MRACMRACVRDGVSACVGCIDLCGGGGGRRVAWAITGGDGGSNAPNSSAGPVGCAEGLGLGGAAFRFLGSGSPSVATCTAWQTRRCRRGYVRTRIYECRCGGSSAALRVGGTQKRSRVHRLRRPAAHEKVRATDGSGAGKGEGGEG